ncbi:NRDE-2, necessary for RNA interference-domain-containing protein [Favolaschia claudopus]|uniref:NRDE-2, necessary for RNA interference-domain-containing protein n=1 Tax=Favolaschia claudopus TaxID=2862362 RepID=A0AAW0EJC4_9AGAR
MSFVPSFSSFPDLPSTSSAPPSSKSKGKEKERKRKRDKDRDVPKTKSVHHDPPPPVEERTHESGSRLYYVDRKGDPLNVQYGSINSKDVPKYRIAGRSILGLPSSYSIFRTSNGIEIGPPGKRKMPSLTDGSSRALLSRKPTRSFVNAVSSSKYEEEDGFLRLPSRAVNANEQSYRSIEKSRDNSDSDSSSAGESDGDDSDEENSSPDSHTATLRLLNERLATHPRSVPNWLSLLSHTLLTVPITSKNASRARSEISVSILARAIAVNGNADSCLLRIKYLQAGEEIWHDSKLRAEWEDALRAVKGVEIWMEWLEWRIRKSSDISVVTEAAKRASAAIHNDEVGQMRVFWRLAVAFQMAGYGERATAMFQAQTELTFQIPQALYGLPLQVRLDGLEEFWESECPRLGETGAKGWGSWYSSGRPSLAPPPSQPGLNSIQDLDPYRKFSFSESFADRTLFIPRRSTDMEADSDPYSTILFSDIRDSLLDLNSSAAKDVLRHAWLTVLGLHLPGFKATESEAAVNWDDRWCHAYFTRPMFLDALFPKAQQSRITNDAVAGVIVGREREYASGLRNPVLSAGRGVLSPLGVPSADANRRGIWTKQDLSGVDVAFIERVFEQLRLENSDVHWDVLTLAFVAASSVKSALKLSRKFLSTAPDSIFHWAAHARLELLRDRPDDARKVYETVLSTPSSPTRPGIAGLWWDWAELEWLSGQADSALKVSLRSAGVEGSGGVMLLRAKRNLDDHAKAAGESEAREGWVNLRALLELLTSSDPEQALRIFDAWLVSEKEGTSEHERLLLDELLLLYRYGTILRKPMPPALLRKRAEKAISLYPSNSILLGLFLESEKGQGVWGKVRNLVGEGGSVEKDVVRRIEEVWVAGWDKTHWEAEVERTRSGLAAAVESERTRRSATLWRIYIEFEIRAGQLHRAKKILFRAVGDCPLVKELYLTAFGALRGVFSAQELDGFADTMAERGVRLRRGLDELLEGWEEENGRDMEEDDNEDEIVDAARACSLFSTKQYSHPNSLRQMSAVPAPSLHHAREEWSDADFDLTDGQPIAPVTDRDDDENEDWDADMDLPPKPRRPVLADHIASAPASSQMFIIRPPQSLPELDDDDDDEGVSTIKVAVLPKPAAPLKTPHSPIDEDFEDAFSLPSDLTQLSLAPLSLNHRVSKTSLEWGDKDQTSSSQSSDAYSSLGFADASPSSNSTSSVELPGTEDEDDDDDDDELEGLVIPTGIFESGKGARHFTKLLEKKKAHIPEDNHRVPKPEEDDFESGLVIDDDFELSPSRLLTNQQLQSQRIFNIRSNSMPSYQRLGSLRPSSRTKLDRAKSPVIARPPTRTQTNPPPAPSSFLSPKPGNLRGQKSHSGLKPPTPPTSARKLTRKASLSSLMETSSNQASGSGSVSAGTSKAGYEEPTAASRAKTFKSRDPFKVPPTRPSTPSSNPAALRLTMPTAATRSKSRPALSSVFHGPSSASGSHSPSLFRSMSPLPPRPLSHLSARLPPQSKPVSPPPRPAAPRVLRRPKRQRLYGDGTELDAFDDLPTDRDKESRFRVQPKGYGNRVPGGSYPSKAERGTVRRKRRDGSDGGSLDGHSPLGPLTTNNAKHSPKSEFPKFADPPRKRKQNSSPSAPERKKKPTLIRNLGGSGAPRVVGDMRWNPQTLRWEGNEQVLREFDAAVGTSTRPALITHLTGSSIGSPVGSFANGARIVGNMIFDPSRMCWISTLPPDEDEPDVFANLADDEDDEEDARSGDGWESKGGTIRASLQLASSSNSSASTATEMPSAAPSPARSESASYVRGSSETSDSERGSRASMVFDVDEAFLANCRAAEERHRIEMKGWNLSSRQDPFSEPDRSYLFEIRELATRKYS